MVSRHDGKYAIYPIYFDKSVSRLSSRKISIKHAVEKPSIEDIFKAAKSLGLSPILEKNIAHPSRHFKKEGRIIIHKKGSKSKILKQIANLL
jgi:signal recognition particle subunit SRP19